MECPKHPLLSRTGNCGCDIGKTDNYDISEKPISENDSESHFQFSTPEEEIPLDVKTIKEWLKKADAEACRRSLSEFVRSSWHIIQRVELEWGQHIETMCWHIQQQLMDSLKARTSSFHMRAQNLLINIPPRSLKTTVLVSANAWVWLHEPALQIMYLSKNPRVATKSARDFRDLIASTWYQSLGVNWQFRADQDALSDMGNTAGGRRLARGLDSMIIGEGADWICIDDPHDARDPISLVQKTCEGYDSAVANRLNDPRTGIRTCIMQRIMVGDFADHVLERQKHSAEANK